MVLVLRGRGRRRWQDHWNKASSKEVQVFMKAKSFSIQAWSARFGQSKTHVPNSLSPFFSLYFSLYLYFLLFFTPNHGPSIFPLRSTYYSPNVLSFSFDIRTSGVSQGTQCPPMTILRINDEKETDSLSFALMTNWRGGSSDFTSCTDVSATRSVVGSGRFKLRRVVCRYL